MAQSKHVLDAGAGSAMKLAPMMAPKFSRGVGDRLSPLLVLVCGVLLSHSCCGC